MAFTVVRYDGKYGQRDGVATTWLQRLVEPITSGSRAASKASTWVPIYLRRCVCHRGEIEQLGLWARGAVTRG